MKMQTLLPFRRQMCNTRDINGFTLIEVLTVLAIISFVAVLIVPRISNGNALEGQQSVANYKWELAKARREAIQSGKLQSISVDDGFQYIPAIGQKKEGILFYPDGSSSGGEILEDGKMVLQIDWLSGRVYGS